MEIINQSVEMLGYCPNYFDEAIQHIMRISKTCYKSKKEVTKESATKFCKNLLDNDPPHTAMLEHSWIGIAIDLADIKKLPTSFVENPYIRLMSFSATEKETIVMVCSNYVGWINALLKYYKSIEPDITFDEIFWQIHSHIKGFFSAYGIRHDFIKNNELPHELRPISVKWTVPRSVTHQIVRHRDMVSIAQESQRYVVYRNGIRFIRPVWERTEKLQKLFNDSCAYVEEAYLDGLSKGLKGQEAREMLSNAVAAEIVITAPMYSWTWMINLRTANNAYLPMRIAMEETKAAINELNTHNNNLLYSFQGSNLVN